MQTAFLNRENDRAQLAGVLADHDTSRVVLIDGATGVGKSTLIDRVLAEEAGRMGLRVRVPRAIGLTHDDGTVVELLAWALHKSEDFPSVERFHRSAAGVGFSRPEGGRIAENFAGSIPIPGVGAAVKAVTRATSIGESSAERTLQPNAADGMIHLQRYVTYCLNRQPAVISIDNVQQIDLATLRMLISQVGTGKSLVMFLEYTPDVSGGWTTEQLREWFESYGTTVLQHTVSPLEYTYYSSLATDTPDAVGSLLRRTYDNTSGNLRTLLDIRTCADSGSSSLEAELRAEQKEHSTKRNLQRASAACQLLVSAVEVHGSAVSRGLLRRILSSPHTSYISFDLDTELQSAKERNLLDVEGDSIRLAHDQVGVVLRESEAFVTQRVISSGFWCDLYEGLLGEPDALLSRQEVLARLIAVCLAIGDSDRLVPQLEELRTMATSALYPERAIQTLSDTTEALSGQVRDSDPELVSRLRLTLVNTYYEIGAFPHALYQFGLLATTDPRAEIMRAALYNRNDRHIEAIDLARRLLLSEKSLSDADRLTVELVVMACHKSLGNQSECRRCYDNMISDETVKSLLEYGYVLRNAEMVVSPREAAHCLAESAALFKDANQFVDEGHARLPLSEKYTLFGEFDAAMMELERAEHLLSGRAADRHMLLNNRAVTLLFKDQDGEAARDHLLDALATSQELFDRITIHSNLLATHGVLREFDRANQHAGVLIGMIESQPDKRLDRTAYYNIHRLYSLMGDSARATSMLDVARSVDALPTEYWQRRLEGRGHEPESRVRGSFPFHLRFLSQWHIPFSI